jgi:glycosyltransferase involved in cell wall biosynthesis
MESAITPDDLLIANPSFSENEFGLRLPGRKLMYVQGFGRPVLDGFFDHYVCASGFLCELLTKLYEIEAPVIPPFIHLDRVPGGPPWDERPPGKVLVMAKSAGEKLLGRFQDEMHRAHRGVRYSLDLAESMPQEELHDAMSRHRYFLTLSPREGFGLAPLEAMAAGCTVVGFHGGGGLEFMRPGENCEAVAYPAMAALCERMAAVLGDEGTASRLAHAGRDTAAGYGLETFERRWVSMLETLLKRSADPLR